MNINKDKPTDVIALGNALLDFLIEIDEERFLEFNLTKGQFHLVDGKQAQELLQKIRKHQLTIDIVPGGSAANTLRALALLGANVILCGKVGDDNNGKIYVEEMRNHGVYPRFSSHSQQTGHALTFITPDAERTFSVHLGAAIELTKEDILEEDIKKSKILHLEGYQLEGKTSDIVLHALQLAQKHGLTISLDVADPGVISRNKAIFDKIITKYADILFLNEIEALEFSPSPEEAIQNLGKHCEIVVVKLGKKGSLLHQNHTTSFISAFPAKAIDTTGAGGSYAAGFLYGYGEQWKVQKAAMLGSYLASKVVELKGVTLKSLDFPNIKQQVEKTWSK